MDIITPDNIGHVITAILAGWSAVSKYKAKKSEDIARKKAQELTGAVESVETLKGEVKQLKVENQSLRDSIEMGRQNYVELLTIANESQELREISIAETQKLRDQLAKALRLIRKLRKQHRECLAANNDLALRLEKYLGSVDLPDISLDL